MIYNEPGITVLKQTNPKYNTGVATNLIPAVVGKGFGTLTRTVAIIRSSAAFDIISTDVVSSITTVGDLRNTTSYLLTTDYTLTTPKITWQTGKGPAVGATYYVTYVYTPSVDHYNAKIMTTKDDVVAEYGPDVDGAGNINNISLAAQIVLETSSSVMILAIAPAGGSIAASDYDLAYTTYLQFLPDVYRVIPVDLAADINLKTINHVNAMSAPEEREERVTILGADHASVDFPTLLTNVGGYASALDNERVAVIYPDKATRVLSDGNSYILKAPFICAAIAGWKAAQTIDRSYTKAQLFNFDTLVGISMTRTQKNLLAGKGVMVLEQTAQGAPVIIRHGLTTNMSSLQLREFSITEVGDYVAKYFRAGLSDYIGVYNITSDFITRLKGSANALISQLIKLNVLLDGSRISQLAQDPDQPDRIILQLVGDVPYPCNNIAITLFLE